MKKITRPVLAVVAIIALPRAVLAYDCNGNHYVNGAGHVVHSPSCAQEMESPHTTECRDGSTSFSEHHQGACSHHGGVAKWD